MVMNSRRSLTMSSTSALKVALANKKESRVLLCILLSFVFCFSSLKICVFADNGNQFEYNSIIDSVPWYSKYAYKFFYQNGFTNVQSGQLKPITDQTQQESYTGEDGNTYFIFNQTQLWLNLYPVGLNGSFSSSNSSNGLRFHSSNNTMYLIFGCTSSLGSSAFSITGSNNSYTTDYSFDRFGNTYIYFYRFRATNSNHSTENVFLQSNVSGITIYPIWVGMANYMPTDVRNMCGYHPEENLLNSIDTKIATTNTYLTNIYNRQQSEINTLETVKTRIENNTSTLGSKIDGIISYLSGSGSSDTQNNVNNNNQVKNTFDTNANNLATFEGNQSQTLDTSLQNLNISSNNGLLVNSSFVKSALWVNNMFDRLIVGSPFELVLVFCLSIGIAFAMIGKVK